MHKMAEEVATVVVGPHMHGQRMSLAEFAHAEAQPGYTYELERGVIVVDVPRLTHETRQGDIWDEPPLDSSATWTTALLPGFALALTQAFTIPQISEPPAA